MGPTGRMDGAGAGMRRKAIAVLLRYPEAGASKTRLIPALGGDGAANVHRAMAEYTVEVAARYGARVVVHYTGADDAAMRAWLGDDLHYEPQGEGDLGARMLGAIEHAFADGAAKAVVVGTDCPGMDGRTLGEAFEVLDDADVVVGPADDGGYYLIGLRAQVREKAHRLFEGVAWGTEGVFAETCARAEAAGLTMAPLTPKQDVDRPEDLPAWERARAAWPKISVVIPALNEESHIEAAVHSAVSAHAECIVVDGGSTDGTVARAAAAGARAIESPRGRALQMNYGAKASEGSLLVFLHADSQLPAGYARHVRTSLALSGVSGSAFRFATDIAGNRSMALFTRIANWRASSLQLPYGDQALFTSRALFEKVGGFPEIALMDDVEFVRRLRRHGRIVIAAAPVITSGRRWRTKGVWRTMAINQGLMAAYVAGVDPARLARWYRGARCQSPLSECVHKEVLDERASGGCGQGYE